MIKTIEIAVSGQGLYPITQAVQQALPSNAAEGLCTLFIQHTSASLLIQEDYDSSARVDLENWLNRLVPENDPLYTHTTEGSDDMPAHIKAALTAVSVAIPLQNGELLLGTWQGIFLWEHRHARGNRSVVIHLNT
ncbi:YjbQ family protein [Halieaceae bacterium IMCC14734]|uniref:YjbQ family protein n=1 Tax=Candidatus Litorirhabdus singularis TaxID=2518993 RepID=A0ABT3TH98_9GAMM|nr:secondary thiamine-phosphate synthase enzyme YjbQ [Candidatus Litorirhabdus singularis]MCX2981651.1 YjbQ family protein [Candidatus Litorirhabdus singularis]